MLLTNFWEITFTFVMIINGCCVVAVVWCYLPLTVTLIVFEIPVRTPFCTVHVYIPSVAFVTLAMDNDPLGSWLNDSPRGRTW